MKKLLLVFLTLVTVLNLILLIIAFTNIDSVLHPYRLVVGLFYMMFGAFLRQHLSSYNRNSKE